jgi:hypothetical protein
MEDGSSKRKLGFSDLCHYFQRSVSEDIEDDTAIVKLFKILSSDMTGI